jgi:uncharacterized membrane protein YraQ (UPF0718 family)
MLEHWYLAARTSLGLFWTAFWAFGLGYLLSSMIQVFVSRERMRASMGRENARSVGLGTVFGFVSSSCSFAALATTRALFGKGAGFVPALAFLLASTNLVVELGMVIALFLGWQFVVAEYVGGVLLIVFMWILVAITRPVRWIEEARRRARERTAEHDDGDAPDWRRLIASREGWRRVAERYVMEWGMVWKDVTIGFTVAGVIAVFVPSAFFQALFVGSGAEDPAFVEVVAQTWIGPVAAFVTFIGSMGNIPLAAVLFANGVSFAGILAFLFSDLVVFPVLRIHATYYGWRMALYIAGVFFVALSSTALLLHYGFAAVGWTPDPGDARTVTDRTFFALDTTFGLDVVFLALTVAFAAWKARGGSIAPSVGSSVGARVLFALAMLSLVWLAVGIGVVPWFCEPLEAG